MTTLTSSPSCHGVPTLTSKYPRPSCSIMRGQNATNAIHHALPYVGSAMPLVQQAALSVAACNRLWKRRGRRGIETTRVVTSCHVLRGIEEGSAGVVVLGFSSGAACCNRAKSNAAAGWGFGILI